MANNKDKFLKNLISLSVNKDISCYVLTILGKQFKWKSTKLMLKNIEKSLQKQELYLQENHYAHVFQDSIADSNWLKYHSFSLTGGAANYSLMYVLFKILDEIDVDCILEFGFGQTSILTTQYVNNKNKDAVLDIVEHDENWIKSFSKNILMTDNINLHHKSLIQFSLNGIESDKYDNVDDIVKDKKYNLIIIDGPYGYNRVYPRTNILDLIPRYLSDNFVIILDDAEREGERNTANLIFDKLTSNNINYQISYKSGLKRQLLITSPNYKFLHWI